MSEESNDVAYGVSYSMIDYDNLSDSEWKAFETDTFNGIYSAGEKLMKYGRMFTQKNKPLLP